mmetsp:Transcript_30136/g.38701  ORF Transcript_30136/g.38701 Transcript_30136/m.38701 type:complete len:115 (+) Transcript_30136:1758-2102(+)
MPTSRDGFDLSAQQFRDRLAHRYGREPKSLPETCDGCGKHFSLQHASDCPKWGLIKIGHNQLRDTCAQLSKMAWGGSVKIEPMVREESGRGHKKALQADFSVRGVWEGSQVAFF